MTVATTVEKLFKPHFGGLRFLVHKDLFHATYSHIGYIQIKYGNTESLRHKEAGLSICILGSDLLTKKSPIRSDPIQGCQIWI